MHTVGCLGNAMADERDRDLLLMMPWQVIAVAWKISLSFFVCESVLQTECAKAEAGYNKILLLNGKAAGHALQLA